MRFFDGCFPLVVAMHASHFDEGEMHAMVEGYQAYFRRGERYALLAVAPGEAVRMGAKERKLVVDWVNDSRVKDNVKRLCVGGTSVLPSAVARHAMTALLWFWTPPCPFRATFNVDQAFDFCTDRIRAAGLQLPGSEDAVRLQVRGHLRAAGGFDPSLGKESASKRPPNDPTPTGAAASSRLEGRR